MLVVALPSAIAFGVAIYAPMGGALGPQGAVAGILGAIALGLVAPLLGGSSRLITAPCAPAAAVLSALAMGFAGSGMQAEQVLTLIGLIGLMAGLIQIALGLAGIGKLIKFIPFPVVSGYLSGVGLIIIGSQVPKFLGVTGAPGLIAALSHPGGWVWQSALIGSAVIAAMVVAPRLTKVVPATIIALLSGLACYGLLGMLGQVPMHPKATAC
ncbi:MAG: SulP family inorganic anion transporter [Betaproteobacteria bacterium]|nr:SulP family inorganic anion transporter [Betaproteobacteria bacterium]